MRRAMNEQPRETRAQEARSAKQVRKTEDEFSWVRPGSLAAPTARAGMVQRWIRIAVGGKDDATNLSRKFREGWSPRKADTIPGDFQAVRIESGRFAGCIIVEGMLLCEMPAKRNNARKRFMAEKVAKKTQAIDAEIRKTNLENKNPAFGKIQKSDRTIPIREVRVQDNEEELEV